jgi:hypothetical protein
MIVDRLGNGAPDGKARGTLRAQGQIDDQTYRREIDFLQRTLRR